MGRAGEGPWTTGHTLPLSHPSRLRTGTTRWTSFNYPPGRAPGYFRSSPTPPRGLLVDSGGKGCPTKDLPALVASPLGHPSPLGTSVTATRHSHRRTVPPGPRPRTETARLVRDNRLTLTGHTRRRDGRSRDVCGSVLGTRHDGTDATTHPRPQRRPPRPEPTSLRHPHPLNEENLDSGTMGQGFHSGVVWKSTV